MHDIAAIKNRYLQDDVQRRLGGLASNMARIGSMCKLKTTQTAVQGLIEESKWFIEWTAVETNPETAVQLADLQLELAFWQSDWDRIWANPAVRAAISTHSKSWSDRILKLSGLLD